MNSPTDPPENTAASPSLVNARYRVDHNLMQLIERLSISIDDLARRTGVSVHLLRARRPLMNAAEYFRTFESVINNADPEQLIEVSRSLIGPNCESAAAVALFSSPDLFTASVRLARFKALCGPLRLEIARDEQRFNLSLRAHLDAWPLPTNIALLELFYLKEAVAEISHGHCQPVSLILPAAHGGEATLLREIDLPIEAGENPGLSFRAEHASLPFAGADTGWERCQPHLEAALAAATGEEKLRDQVKRLLARLLPAGESRADAVASQLAMSKRTLQRRLSDEGTHFQALLDELRAELAEAYRQQGLYNPAETAALLAYNDLQSFQRARRRWRRTLTAS